MSDREWEKEERKMHKRGGGREEWEARVNWQQNKIWTWKMQKKKKNSELQNIHTCQSKTVSTANDCQIIQWPVVSVITLVLVKCWFLAPPSLIFLQFLLFLLLLWGPQLGVLGWGYKKKKKFFSSSLKLNGCWTPTASEEIQSAKDRVGAGFCCCFVLFLTLFNSSFLTRPILRLQTSSNRDCTISSTWVEKSLNATSHHYMNCAFEPLTIGAGKLYSLYFEFGVSADVIMLIT